MWVSCKDKPRPLAVGDATLLLVVVVELLLSVGGLPLFATFPVLALISRMARAPKLRRRPNVGVGLPAADGVGASSSKGLSSTEPEVALLTLSRRPLLMLPKGEVWLGEVAERPTVVRERRRWFAWWAAVAMGPG